MIRQVEPWLHRETGWTASHAAQSESMLSLSNGYLGLRGTLDEGEPAVALGTYLNGFYEALTIPYGERGYADPELDQVLVAVADGTRIRLEVDGDPLDVRSGVVEEHERVLDLRGGVLSRTLRWRSPTGHRLAVKSRRLVSLVERELAAIEYEVHALDRPVSVVVRSDLTTDKPASRSPGDPRAGARALIDTLVPKRSTRLEEGGLLVHATLRSENVVAAGMVHRVLSAPTYRTKCEASDSVARWSVECHLEPDRPMRIVKFLAYHWALHGRPEALGSEARQSLERARAIGFDALAERQRVALDHLWASADIEFDGDPEVQHALRYALFQVHQNAVFAAGHGIPAKGLTGTGYNGHTFWDTEIFLLPVLLYCAPDIVRDALLWRASTLPQARANAGRLGLRGAAFPWRTIAGEECSGYLPAGAAALHINADIADAVVRYMAATGDEEFEREAGAALLVETARLWRSAGYFDPRRGGRFSIDGVTGPDEYSTFVDNNLYTNLMARANLRAAADAADRLGCATLGVDPEEPTAWRLAAEAMMIPYDADLGIHLQDEDFARHEPFPFDSVSPGSYPLFLHVPYFQLYRHQVVKQPDLVLAMALHGEDFGPEEKRRNFGYYEALTVRDSSLSAGTQAVVAAEVGDAQLAYEYLAEAALLDHHDLNHNTADGLHLAALAGCRIAVVQGLAGVRERDGRLSFAPRLPDGLRRVAFPLTYHGRQLYVEIGPTEAAYRLRLGESLGIEHWGTAVTLTEAVPVSLAIPPPPLAPRFRQPPSRAPARRNAPR